MLVDQEGNHLRQCNCPCVCVSVCVCVCTCAHTFTLVLWCVQLFATLDCSPPGSSVHGTLQARKLECVAISSSSGGSSRPRDKPAPLEPPALAGGFSTSEPPGKPVKWGASSEDCHYSNSGLSTGSIKPPKELVKKKKKPRSTMSSSSSGWMGICIWTKLRCDFQAYETLKLSAADDA